MLWCTTINGYVVLFVCLFICLFISFRAGSCFISSSLTCSSFLLPFSATLSSPSQHNCSTRFASRGRERGRERERWREGRKEGAKDDLCLLCPPPPTQGTLRVLLVLLHDFPEFLCDYHFSFCDVIPPNCIQMRNLILSAFPRNMRLPDPFTPNLKVRRGREGGREKKTSIQWNL